MVSATALYAALLSLLFVGLARNVIVVRRRRQIALGAESDPDLLRRVRVQANFAEYVPLALLLMAFAEIQGLSALFIHGLGLMLLAGRLSHAIGLSRTPEDFRFRVTGMGLTFTVLTFGAAANLVLSAGSILSTL